MKKWSCLAKNLDKNEKIIENLSISYNDFVSLIKIYPNWFNYSSGIHLGIEGYKLAGRCWQCHQCLPHLGLGWTSLLCHTQPRQTVCYGPGHSLFYTLISLKHCDVRCTEYIVIGLDLWRENEYKYAIILEIIFF